MENAALAGSHRRMSRPSCRSVPKGIVAESTGWRGFSLVWLAVFVLTVGCALGLAPQVVASAAASNAITIDGASRGAVFDGIGAISGGGGNARLLIDYPEPERSSILDYLFTPGYGASLQLLKLEIGGDANSTDGAEPSHEHAEGHVDCNSGYEWWIAQQAVERNPTIKLYGLQWAAPGWTGIWTSADIRYLLDWLHCATRHGLTINYLGGWNERAPSDSWYVSLRRALNAAGYTEVKIVAADSVPFGGSTAAAAPAGGPSSESADPSEMRSGSDYNPSAAWEIASDMTVNPALRAAVAVIGAHDTCGYPTTGYSCYSTPTARSLGKPLWESEIGAMDANSGAPDMVRSINNGFIQARITGYLEWPLIDAMPAGLPLQDRGLVTADQPWSGHFTVDLMTWAIAQTTQFVPAGWVHVGGADGSLRRGGTFAAYQSPNHSGWSMVTETTAASAAQTITVQVRGRLGDSVVHVWATDLGSGRRSDWFVPWPDVVASGGKFTYLLPPGYVITFTTTTGQGKGVVAIPPSAAMALPYHGLAELHSRSVPEGEEPPLLAAEDGAFQYAPCGDGSGMDCVRQTASGTPIWFSSHDGNPYAVLGDRWTQPYTVAADVSFSGSDQTAGVIGRFGNQAGFAAVQKFAGYELEVSQSGGWELVRNSPSAAPAILASGRTAALRPRTWHRLSLMMNGSRITASIDGRRVRSVTDSAYASGSAGIMTGGFYPVAFRNLAITATGG